MKERFLLKNLLKGKKEMRPGKKYINSNYLEYVKSISPKTKQKRSLFRAFWVGGFICCIGQGLRYFFQYSLNLQGDELSSYVSMVMVFLGAFLTGLGVYDRIGKYAGGGSIVPITGFANSVSSTAIEYKREGQVFGIGSKIFNIAGPVILYGIVTSWALGFIYWLLTLLGIF